MGKLSVKGCGSGNNQRGNLNALRSGTCIPLPRLVKGATGIKAVDDEVRDYRRGLEAVVIGDKGLATVEQIVAVQKLKDWKVWEQFVELHVDAHDQHAINLAVAATATAAINRWLLRHRDERKMSVADIRGCADSIAKASRQRLDAIRLLELRAPAVDPWTELDTRVVTISNINGHAQS